MPEGGNAVERKEKVSALLIAWRDGDPKAAASLVRVVYAELRKLARQVLSGERGGHSLRTTALIHEVYLRLIDANVQWQNSRHFFIVAARAMRRLLVDHARKRNLARRAGVGEVRVSLGQVRESPPERQLDVLALNDALRELAEIDPRSSQIVELHYFGGLTLKQTARVIGVSLATAKNDWSLAKNWLYQKLKKSF